MTFEEDIDILALIGQADSPQIIEVDDVNIQEMPADGNMTSLGGEGKTTTVALDQGKVVTLKRRKAVYAHDQVLVLDPSMLAGACSVHKERGVLKVITRVTADQCAICGRLLCGDCQIAVGENVYCPDHGRWRRRWDIFKKIFIG